MLLPHHHHQVTPLNNFMYMVTLESTGMWWWIGVFIYVRLTTFPWLGLAMHPDDWKALFPVPLVIFWIMQALAALIYAHQYYPGMQHSVIHALVLPMLVIPWFIFCVWAKLLWRGYQGRAPEMHWPNLDPAVLPMWGGDVVHENADDPN